MLLLIAVYLFTTGCYSSIEFLLTYETGSLIPVKRTVIMVVDLWRQNRIHCNYFLLLITVFCVVYGKSLGHEFLVNWDDDAYITANAAIRGITLENLKSIFTSNYVGNYAPMQMLSYMLDNALWGMRPFGFILTNITLHALNGMLVYVIVFQLTGKSLHSFLASFIFMFHPVQVESVEWLSQRKNLLAMFFFLCSFATYHYYGTSDRWRELCYGISLTAFILSLLAKSVTVILPVVLLVYDYCYAGKGKQRGNWLDKMPFFLCAAASSLVAIRMQAPEAGGGRIPYIYDSVVTTMLTMLPVYVRYLANILLPTGLSPTYSYAIKSSVDVEVLGSIIILSVFMFLSLRFYLNDKKHLFWLVAALICFIPVSQIVPLVTLMNDRYLYISFIGVAPFLAGTVLNTDDYLAHKNSKYLLRALFCLWLLFLPLRSFVQVDVWKNSLTLWSSATKESSESFLAWNMLATTQMQLGKNMDAAKSFQRALAINPKSKEVLNNFAMFCQLNGSYAKAEENYLKLLELYPGELEALKNLGFLYYTMGEHEKAITVFDKVLKLKPELDQVLVYAGSASFAKGDFLKSRAYFKRALSGKMRGEAEFGLATVDARTGNIEEGVTHLEEAFKFRFNDLDTMVQGDEMKNLKQSPRYIALLKRYGIYR